MSQALSVGVIGCGEIAQQYHLPILTTVPGFDVEWVCDLNLERARQCAATFGIGQSFRSLNDCSGVQAVIVATPVGSRLKLLETIAARGWHAFCEKPFAPGPSQHEEMLGMAER